MTSSKEWNDGLGSRSRRPWALIILDGKIVEFKGSDIPGVVAVEHAASHRAGKWSNTDYTLVLRDGARWLAGRNGWESGTFLEGLESASGKKIVTWIDCAESLGVSIIEAQRWIRAERPKSASKLDEIEASIAAVDDAAAEADSEASVVEISFGSPTNRMMAAGYWDWPVLVLDDAGVEIGKIAPDRSAPSGWTVASGNVALLSAERSSGHHGGHVHLRVAAPEGATLCHGEVL